MSKSDLKSYRHRESHNRSAFTLVELLVVIAVIGILVGILLPTLARSKARAQAIFCLNNTKQLTLAWIMYADDHNGRLAYNLGENAPATVSISGPSMARNWANNVLTWGLDTDNTNSAALVETGLGPYAAKSVGIYRCPSDRALSSSQRGAGWDSRVRSYSMNAMVGDAGSFSTTGENINNPGYMQFFDFVRIPQPANIFVFLDEHPDSIDDGYFLNKAETREWHDLPASWHDGGACFSFADGHSEMHKWRSPTTKPPPVPGAAHLPIRVPSTPQAASQELEDYYWVVSRMSQEQSRGYQHSTPQ
jgi:prepilin-type N-terminal cleavage/methylation domain-containing protein/prepilin-type processing-associated H-X9-DG protein